MQRAGARAAIASLWEVNDGSTQTLMNAFYRLLKQGNITKAEALRQAQMALINSNASTEGSKKRSDKEVASEGTSLPRQGNSRLNHPYYWAPFILIGNGL